MIVRPVSSDELAAFVRAGDRSSYIRAWYGELRLRGVGAVHALRVARVFWGAY